MQHESTSPRGYCACGCGERTNIARQTDRRSGEAKGEPRRFKRGHHFRLEKYGATPAVSGPPRLCACGCGQETRPTDSNRPDRDLVRGEYARWVRGHHAKKLVPWYARYEVEEETGCWVWTGAVGAEGYGVAWIDKSNRIAHRAMYERQRGPIPQGLQLDHLCRNRACVNPSHLESVTAAVNVQRGATTKLTPRQVIEIRKSDLSNLQTARTYGISLGHVSAIRLGRVWKNIPVHP